MIRKCKDCEDYYETEDRLIVLSINHKDIEALEDGLFCELSEKDYKKINPRLNKIWKQICNGEDKWNVHTKTKSNGEKA